MKRHVGNAGVGGILVPIALAIAAAIANEAQTLLGLRLHQQALAIFILPFLAGAALVIRELIKLELSKLLRAAGALVASGAEPPEGLGAMMGPLPTDVGAVLRQGLGPPPSGAAAPPPPPAP